METIIKYGKQAFVPSLVLAAALYFGFVGPGKNTPAFLQK